MALLEANNIETFYGPVVALRGVSIKVDQGSIVTVLGANGAGKTTLLKTVSGAMDPNTGTVQLKGEEIQGMNTWDIARRGMIHVPEGREMFAHLTVRENLMMGAFTRRDRDAVATDIEMVYSYFPRLQERESQAAGKLSGGEQQMVAISRALMARPDVILLDEPSLGLSPLLTQSIFEIIRRLNTERGVTIVLVEQNARLALELAAFGYVLELGRVVLEGTAHSLRENRDVQEFYLGQREAGVRGERRWKRKKQWR